MTRAFANPIAVAVIAVLLCVLAVLQYRWIGAVADAERDRLRASLNSAAQRFSNDFDREVGRAFGWFHLVPEAVRRDAGPPIAEAFLSWKSEAPYPDLVKAVYLTDRMGNRLSCLDRAMADFVSCEPPANLQHLLGRLRAENPPPRADAGAPALVAHFDRPGQGPRLREVPPRPPRLVIAELDLEFIAKQLFPELLQEHFAGLDCAVGVVEGAGGAVLFQSDPSRNGDLERPGVIELPIFSLRQFRGQSPADRNIGDQFSRRPRDDRPLALPPPRPESQGPPPEDRRMAHAPERDQGLWTVVVNHESGSLEDVVGSLQTKNLILSAAILAVLAASLALIVVSARRAQRLARQQVEFVAGVSHELKTPLAAIRSAGENLAQGLVTDRSRISQYGQLVEREGRRLTRMVHQLLELARMQAEAQPRRAQPVDVEDLVNRAVDDTRWILEERGIEILRRVPADLPPVQGDPEGLRRALGNLIENAVKHGGDGNWVRVSASRDIDESELVICVEDRGSGIEREDLEHIFEPFYRGRSNGAKKSGSGLGLALVKRTVEDNGGRVEIGTGRDGTTVTMYLPLPDLKREVEDD